MSEIKNMTVKIKNYKSLTDLNIDEFVKFGGDADKLTKKLKPSDIKTSQLRKFFAAVKKIELDVKDDKKWNDIKSSFHLLMPQLAYAKSRSLISSNFYELIKNAMDKVDSLEAFEKFITFLESIVAYYKANNPKSK
jgi:CRISPR-associated protein Csm2